jgi:hypothetical protein
MQALEGRPTEAISRPSPSSDRNLLARSRQKDGALVTDEGVLLDRSAIEDAFRRLVIGWYAGAW